MGNFEADKEFLKERTEKVRKDYEEKRAKQKSSETMMMTLAWDLHGFEELLSQCAKFTEVVRQIKGTLSLPRSTHGNIKAEVSTAQSAAELCEEPLWKEENSCHACVCFYDR